MNTNVSGARGEVAAAAHLQRRGYRILARNFRTRSGEIDIVAVHGNCICFVEVKSRMSYEAPQEAVSLSKQRRLTRMAQVYLQKYHRSLDVECRFDVVAVQETADGKMHIEVFENAFDAIL